MTEQHPVRKVVVKRRFDHPPGAVFDAWLDPEAVGTFLFATPGGVMKKVEIDPRVGGKLEIAEQRGETLARHVGEYLEIDRPRRPAKRGSPVQSGRPSTVARLANSRALTTASRIGRSAVGYTP